MKQTAVEWLVNQMLKQGYFEKDKPLTFTNLGHLQHQAEEMEKQQIIDIVEKSRATGLTAEYLLLTYGSKGSDETFANGSEKQYLSQINTSQTEISDEEIEEMLFHHSNEYAYGFKDAIKWYREQLKSRQ